MKEVDMMSAESLWQDLLDKDDRTSPAEYPSMALITFEEFSAALDAQSAERFERFERKIAELNEVIQQQASELFLITLGLGEKP